MQLFGVTNPRSFTPTQSFHITSYDVDGVSEIDIGFNKNVAMEISGTITEFSLLRQSEINGEKNDYTFTIKNDIPLQVGDVLKFVFPVQVVPYADGSTT